MIKTNAPDAGYRYKVNRWTSPFNRTVSARLPVRWVSWSLFMKFIGCRRSVPIAVRRLQRLFFFFQNHRLTRAGQTSLLLYKIVADSGLDSQTRESISRQTREVTTMHFGRGQHLNPVKPTRLNPKIAINPETQSQK
uniref:(northern house mosquito) hypothetical protein n=1 Tax=Culex pipiens TaxID=7175 RepID=A0A8D8HTM6_CULPI